MNCGVNVVWHFIIIHDYTLESRGCISRVTDIRMWLRKTFFQVKDVFMTRHSCLFVIYWKSIYIYFPDAESYCIFKKFFFLLLNSLRLFYDRSLQLLVALSSFKKLAVVINILTSRMRWVCSLSDWRTQNQRPYAHCRYTDGLAVLDSVLELIGSRWLWGNIT